MTITFKGVSVDNRKALVQAISEATGDKSEYLGIPSYSYKVGPYTINRDGGVDADEFADQKEIGQLLLALRARDYVPTQDFSMLEEPPRPSELEACLSQPDVDGITLSFPKNGMDAQSVDNLRKLISGKAWLLRMAVGTDALPMEEDEDTLRFPWLAATAPSELVKACTQLIAALIKLARKQKRVTLTGNANDNPRYAFRCFMLRLGFIGDEYKEARKLLIRNLPGNSSKRHVSAKTAGATDAPDTTEAANDKCAPDASDNPIASGE